MRAMDACEEKYDLAFVNGSMRGGNFCDWGKVEAMREVGSFCPW